MSHPVRLNLGAGDAPLPGYDNSFDRRQGRDCYPLALPDNYADEVRASHVLEHFSHRDIPTVLAEWTRVLRPGGLLKVAVPDLEVIARGYLARHQAPWDLYLMGAHADRNDVHGAVFDAPSLAAALRRANLVGVQWWNDGAKDASALPVSLNLAAWKRPTAWPKLIGVMSMPRLGFTANFVCVTEAVAKLGIEVRTTTGAFWGQCLTRAIEDAIAKGCDWILTWDYDTVFDIGAVEDLVATAMNVPGLDAVIPVQMGRGGKGMPLMTVSGDDGKPVGEVAMDRMRETVVPVLTGHFGCTLLRASAFAELPRPWFHSKPDESGGWGDGRIDDDIAFWINWREAGRAIHLAPRCVVGHAVEMIRWPDHNLEPIHQDAADYRAAGAPWDVWQ